MRWSLATSFTSVFRLGLCLFKMCLWFLGLWLCFLMNHSSKLLHTPHWLRRIIKTLTINLEPDRFIGGPILLADISYFPNYQYQHLYWLINKKKKNLIKRTKHPSTMLWVLALYSLSTRGHSTKGRVYATWLTYRTSSQRSFLVWVRGQGSPCMHKHASCCKTQAS